MSKANGFIKFIVLIIIAVLVLSYLHIDVGGVVSKTANFLTDLWNTYLKDPVMNFIVNPLLGLISQFVKK
jgi:hypothetical protein